MGNRLLVDIVRHGRTPLNERGIIQGSSDRDEDGNVIGLSEFGKLQVGCLCDALRAEGYDRILASPLTRVIQSAEALRDAVKGSPKIEIFHELTERDVGRYTHHQYKKIELYGHPSIVTFLTHLEDPEDTNLNPNITPKPGVGPGQRLRAVIEQTRSFYHSLLSGGENGRVLIVTSDVRTQYLIGEILGVRRKARIPQHNCAINRILIYWPDVGARADPFVDVQVLNYTEHLKDLFLRTFGTEDSTGFSIPGPFSSPRDG
ncbi:histidine phosphatase family protein [Candidatus Woesearchaeota archaeon]|nr:histidine phosphatase family protein [Candidatus Woesearchaeota archaeon]